MTRGLTGAASAAPNLNASISGVSLTPVQREARLGNRVTVFRVRRLFVLFAFTGGGSSLLPRLPTKNPHSWSIPIIELPLASMATGTLSSILTTTVMSTSG